MNKLIPSGKLVLLTSQGNLEIGLFCNESPIACRNFVQNCLEGYYDNSLIYRIIPDFLIECGLNDIENKPNISIYKTPYPNEINKNLNFNDKGIIGMVNDKNNLNNNNFFISLREINSYNKKKTIIGKILQNSWFNLSDIENQEINEEYEPKIKLRIISTKVINHPFDDLVINPDKYSIKIKQVENKKINKIKLEFDDELDNSESQEELIQNINMHSMHDLNINKNYSSEIYQKKIIKIKNIQNKETEKDNTEEKPIEKIISQNISIINEDEKNIKNVEIYKNNEEFNTLKAKYMNLKHNKEVEEENEFLDNISENNINEESHDSLNMNNNNEDNRVSKLKNFINTIKNQEDNWFSKKIKFHIDSHNFYS